MASLAKFYDGKTAQVHEVGVRPTASELIIFRPADSTILVRWPVAELRILGDVEHEVIPKISRKGDHARVLVEDPDLRRQLAIALPVLTPLVAPRPSPLRRSAIFGSMMVLLFAFFWAGIDAGSERLAPHIPYSLQVQLGESVLDELVANHVTCRGEKGLDAINKLANRLADAGGYGHPVSVTIVEGGPVNALTLPGGIMVFYSDLISEARDGSEVAGVLAHEMGHVVHYHSMKALARQYGIDLLLKVVTGGYSDMLNTLTSGGGLLLALRNGRAAERESDATGVALLEKLGLRADGVATFFETIMKDDDAAAKAGIWSSHPPTRERIASTRRPPTGAPPFSAEEWKALRAVCE
jgi:Zn-dependent protease with chaperone function